MNNLGSTLAKIAALLGGAVAGALLAEWFDKQLSSQAQTRSEHDRTRYEQGLTPLTPQPSSPEERAFEVRSLDRDQPYDEV
jgi:hypothetical protein